MYAAHALVASDGISVSRSLAVIGQLVLQPAGGAVRTVTLSFAVDKTYTRGHTGREEKGGPPISTHNKIQVAIARFGLKYCTPVPSIPYIPWYLVCVKS